MKNIYHIKTSYLSGFVLLILGLAFGSSGFSQQNIGAHPNIDAGFENQATANLGTTQSATAWTYVSSGSSQLRAVNGTGGYGGPKYNTIGRSVTTTSSTTHNSNQVTTGTFLANTKYIVQFHFRKNAASSGIPDPASFVFISYDGTSAGRKSTTVTLGTPPENWTKFTSTVVTDAAVQTSTGTCGINIRNQATPSAVATTIDLDNFVVYPADNQDNPLPDEAAPGEATDLVATGNPAVIDLSWKAPTSGVDGGGYLVVRFTADPVATAQPDPLKNAVYKANAANTIGTTGTVVYVGTDNFFSDGGGTAGTNYYYRVYSVDKAFNYSAAIVSGPVSPLSKTNYYYDGTGATDEVTNWWTNTNGTGTNPPNFTAAGQIFRIVTDATLTGSISGTGSLIIIGAPAPGVNAVTVNFNTSTLPAIDTIYQSSDGNPTILNFNTATVPPINQLFDIFTEAHYRAAGIAVSTSKIYNKIMVENNADVIFNGSPIVTTSFKIDEGSTATVGTLSTRWLQVNDGGTATINGKIIVPKLVGLSSSNVGTAASTGGAIQFIGVGDVVLGPASTVEYAGISTSTTQNITPRTDYVNMILSGVGISKTFTGITTLSGGLTLNMTGATGALLTGGALTVNGALTLTSGKLTTNATNILVLGSNSSISGGSNASFINGPVRRNTNAATAYVFPVGKTTYAPVVVTPATNTASLYQAEYFNTAYSDITNFTAPLTGVSNASYWDISIISGANASVSLSLNGTPITGATGAQELVVARYTAGSWVSENETPIASGDATTGTAVSKVLSAFSPFTFGIKPSSALPLSLLSFGANRDAASVKLNWTTTNESKLLNFHVEASKEGSVFTSIGTINARNIAGIQQYHFTSPNSFYGHSFFRIKISSLDGRIQYSNIIAVKAEGAGQRFSIVNNPARNNTLQIQMNGLSKANYNLKIINMQGQIVQQQSIQHAGGFTTQQINLPAFLSKGSYVALLSHGSIMEQVQFILQ